MSSLGALLAAKDPNHQVKVFGIGIGTGTDAADIPSLRRISDATGASTTDLTHEPTKLNTAFADIFGSVSPGR